MTKQRFDFRFVALGLALSAALTLPCRALAQLQFAQQGSKLVGTGAAGPGQQGTSVAISGDGNTAIVGGPSDDCSGQGCVGAAWVYTRSGGVWSQQGEKLVGAGALGGAYQGSSVAISGDGTTVVIGGVGDDSNAGAVWVFTRNNGAWSQQGSKLVGTGAVGKAQQGATVAISADESTLIVGGPQDDPDNPAVGGAAWIFARSAGVWSQQGGKLVGNDAGGPGLAGSSVAISADGSTAIVGGPWDYITRGASWIFVRNGKAWSQQGGKLVGTGPNTLDTFQGYSVAISADGSTVIVGAAADDYQNDLGGANGVGAARVYVRNASAWSQQGNKLVGAGGVGETIQGFSVALSSDGNTAVVGGVDDNSVTGAAWVYSRSGGQWSQTGSKLVGIGADGTAWQGYSVAASADGKTIIVGGPGDHVGTGAAWVFTSELGASPRPDDAPKAVGNEGAPGRLGGMKWSAEMRPAASMPLAPPPQQFVLDFGAQTPHGPSASVTEQVTAPLDPGNNFTIEFWLYLESASPNTTLFVRYLPQFADFLYAFYADSSGTAVGLWQNSGTGARGGTPAATIPLRTWTHIAGTLAGQTLSLLVNGAIVFSVQSPGPPASVDSSFYQFGRPGALMALRQVRIWSRALTPAEITANAVRYVEPSSPGLVACWAMDEGSGRRIHDDGPNHADIDMPADYTSDLVSPRWIHTSILENGPYFSFEPYEASAPLGAAGFMDFNHDGILDILGVQAFEGPVFAFVNDGHGHFADATTSVFGGPGPSMEDHVRYLRVADFDGDGLMDCLVAGTDEGAQGGAGGQAHLLMQKPGGHLSDETTARLPIQNTFTHSITLGDIDGRGAVDIFMGNYGTPLVPWPVFYINDGMGHFAQDPARIPAFARNSPSESALLVDTRRSGSPDLVRGRAGGIQPHDSLLVNDGTGHFTFVPDAALPLRCGGPDWSATDVATGDFDGDGWPDLVLALNNQDYTQTCIQLLLNNGNGTFRDASDRLPPQDWTPGVHTQTVWQGSNVHELETVDLNGDGWVDFIAHGIGVAESRVYINTGGGYFVDATDVLPMKSGGFGSFVSGDVDNDGMQDLLATAYTPDNKGGLYVFRQLRPLDPVLLFSGGPCTVLCGAIVPGSAVAGAQVAFTSTATPVNCTGSVSYDWDFGDGSSHSSQQNPTHSYALTGAYTWTLNVTAGGLVTTRRGTVRVQPTPPASNPALFLPVVLDNVAGVGGSHYTTELTLASKATSSVEVSLLYNASVGTGTGSVSVTLAPGETRIIPNALAFLRSQGLAIPVSGSAIGTLQATFASASSDPFIGGRTFTAGGGGTFGLFYSAAATSTSSATLIGLQQSASQRSNVALANAGATPIVLRVQLFGPTGEAFAPLPDVSLPPYTWKQINLPFQGLASSGLAVVTEVSGSSPFTAYGVLNDAVTSDGSFIPPLIGNGSGPGDRLVPIILDVHGLGGTHYTTELTLANLTSSSLPVTFVYTASLGSGSGQASLTLAAGEQRIMPDAIGFLRSQGLAIPFDGSSVGGSLLALPPAGTPPSAFAVGARTFTPASSGGGAFGLYYPGVTLGESATSVAFVNGLQQNDAQRSNLALVNRGDASDSIDLRVSYFDATGVPLGTPTTVTLAAGQWTQFAQPLYALGATSGYAKIEKTSGASRFVAYGVLNDAVTSDGSYIPMSW